MVIKFSLAVYFKYSSYLTVTCYKNTTSTTWKNKQLYFSIAMKKITTVPHQYITCNNLIYVRQVKGVILVHPVIVQSKHILSDQQPLKMMPL